MRTDTIRSTYLRFLVFLVTSILSHQSCSALSTHGVEHQFRLPLKQSMWLKNHPQSTLPRFCILDDPEKTPELFLKRLLDAREAFVKNGTGIYHFFPYGRDNGTFQKGIRRAPLP